MIPDSNQTWSRERFQAIKDTFTQIITRARDLEVDCLFIAGDLFHRQPLARDLKELNYLFSTIPSIHVVIIAGNHDHIRKTSAIHGFSWCPNVTMFLDEEMDSVYFPEINTEVHGFSYHSTEIRESRIDHLEIPDDRRIHILLAHGGDASHLPFHRSALPLPLIFPTLLWGIFTSRKSLWKEKWHTPVLRSLWTRQRQGSWHFSR